MVELFAAGGVIVDNVVAPDGRVHLETMGGNAVYAAAGARLWSGSVGIVANVPSNYPRHWLDALRDAGLRLDGITEMDEAVTRSEWLIYRADGSRIDHLHAPRGFRDELGIGAIRLTPQEIAGLERSLRALPVDGLDYAAFRRRHPIAPDQLPQAFVAARGAHLAPEQTASQIGLARRLRRNGTFVTTDPGFHATTMADDVLGQLLAGVDAFLPSEAEQLALCPELAPAAALRAWAARGVRVAGVKLGARGSCLFDRARDEMIDTPALGVVARDPTGAGDAYCGGFLAGFVRSGDVRIAACCATVSASFAIEAFGPFHLLTTTRVAARARLGDFVREAGLTDVADCLHLLA